MTHREFLEKMGLYSNYIIIAIASLISVFFFPFLGSTVGLALVLPNTVAGWIVFVATKLCVGAINVLIFHCFVQQAKVNVREHPSYLEARRILDEEDHRDNVPLSPKQFFAREYGVKGASVFILSVLSAFSLAQAILAFDLVMMLTYIFTIVGGIIAGFLEMKKVEDFWIYDYLNYAKDYRLHKRKLDSSNIGGSSVLESSDNSCAPSPTN